MSNLSIEKLTIGVLLIVAWGWIMVTIGMVFYHGYNNPLTHSEDKHHHNHLLTGVEPPMPVRSDLIQDTDDRDARGSNQEPLGHGTSPLLLFTFRRADYLRETLDTVLRYIPHDCQSVACPVIVSQDGDNADVTRVIQDFARRFQEIGIPLLHWQHSQDHPPVLRGSLARIANAKGYAALAQHYKWALDKVFSPEPTVLRNDNKMGEDEAMGLDPAIEGPPERVIILEEDLRVAPDFFDYFAAMAPLLDVDDTLLAVSAYNDNGLQGKVHNVTRLLRSDFFPGLGWMMNRRLWTLELSDSWPLAFWDDWLRELAQRKGRHIVRPEVSRTFHFGSQGGTSNNQFGHSLHDIYLNPTPVTWSQQDLSYLEPGTFQDQYWQLIQSARLMDSVDDVHAAVHSWTGDPEQASVPPPVLRLEYHNLNPEFQRIAKRLGLFSDEKAGVPRTAYKGVVETRMGGAKGPLVLVTPPITQLQELFD